MQLDAPIQPVLDKVESTLRNGHTVWLVGYYPFSNPPRPAPNWPRPGVGVAGRLQLVYISNFWSRAAGFFRLPTLWYRGQRAIDRASVDPILRHSRVVFAVWTRDP